MKRPNDQSTLEEVVEWLHSMDFEVTNKAYAYFSKVHKLTPQELYLLVYNQEPTVNGVETHLITPNKLYGPLSLKQKQEVYQHHKDAKTQRLAALYNTNPQNITLAKRGEHNHQRVQPDYSKVTPITPSAAYGPLTLEQKQEIYHNHRDVPPKVLAHLYKTNHQNVRLAQRTLHHGKSQHSDDYILAKAALILNMPLATLKALKIEV